MNNLDIICSLLEKTRGLGADSADAVLFETAETSASVRLGKPEGIERAESQAVGLRAFFGARQAIASATDLSEEALSELANRAVSMAKIAPPDPDLGLAPQSRLMKSLPALDLADDREPSADWMTKQCEEAENAARADKDITNSEGASAGFSMHRIHLAVMNGSGVRFAQSYGASHHSLSVSVVAGNGTFMERDYDFTSARHLSDLDNPASVGERAATRAKARLNPRKVKTQTATIVFDPRVSKNLLSIFASAISGSAVSRGASFLKDSMGKPIFAKNITITDDPHIVRGLGSRPFDGEGVAGKKLSLIENGVLKSWLLDVRTANKLKLETTGHASRGVASPPSPSSTNLFMGKGAMSPEELIGDIKNGLYVTETFGMGVNIVTGDYSQGASGFWIENGQRTFPVSEITIAGKLQDMFLHLTPANDLEFSYATNAPTLRIEAMTIAGN